MFECTPEKPEQVGRKPRGNPNIANCRPTGPKTWCAGKPKIVCELSPPQLEEFHALLRDPRTTIVAAHRWLRERGFGISEAAVRRYHLRFDQRLQEVRHRAELAFAVSQHARQAGVSGFTEAALTRFLQLHMDMLLDTDLAQAKARDPKEWLTVARAIASATRAKVDAERDRDASARRQRRAHAARARARKRSAAAPEREDLITRVERLIEHKH